ncbi:MAG: hypothetical protein IMW98_11025 [Firmicutes bacterium]|nr:hypothetical protein [Bacillota bacterium]
MADLELVDLTPRFLDFYDAARAERAGPERRWQLWQERYGFAAVPPTPEGQELARRLLDEAWDRYPLVMDRIRAGAAGLQPAPLPVLERVAALLGCPAVAVRLVVFAGFLAGNACGYVDAGRPTCGCLLTRSSREGRWRSRHQETMVMVSRRGRWPSNPLNGGREP